MDRKRLNESGLLAGGIALGALACVWLLAASSAWAASGKGSAELKLAQHDNGRTLSGQGGKIVVGKLPITELDLAKATATTSGNFSFRKGSREVALSGIHFDFAAGTLNGLLDGQETAVFKLGPAQIDPAAGSVRLSEAVLRFTPEAARVVREKLGLTRALRHNGVGMLWLSAQQTASQKIDPAPPKPTPVVRPVVSGSIDWGFKSSWRAYVLTAPPAGSQEVLEGATATGPLTSPATTYGFTGSSGSLTAVPNGAVEALTLASGGAVKWAKPGHGISEVRFSDLEIEIGGDGSWLVGDVKTEIGPPAESDEVRIAELETAAVTPVWSDGGDTLTWSEVPATLTAEGAASFSGFYEAGTELDPVTITAGLG
ncbi:MAG TPA: HtaA domain-containing protein [Solirubrobacterales bacterium]|nr:HtaA domain-containing protein [Solirubrobacterales bacterium]